MPLFSINIEKVVIQQDDGLLKEILRELKINNQKIIIMGEKTDQAIADLALVNEKLVKIGGESAATLQKVIDLENAAANADTPQVVLDAIAAVKAQAQIVDDLVPDPIG